MINSDFVLSGRAADEYYARINAGGTTSFLTDDLGSTVALTNASGATTASYAYAPYGATSESGTDGWPMQFTGRENDLATNLYYYRARYYSPQLGRFISQDPIGLGGGINFYAYVDGNPISETDPSGLQGIEVEPPIEQLPAEVRQNNSWNDPNRQLRREFRQPWTPPVSQIPKQQCWTTCPAQNACGAPASPPLGMSPTPGHPGCFSQCSSGPFMSAMPPQAPPLQPAPPRTMTNGDWGNFWSLVWTFVSRK